MDGHVLGDPGLCQICNKPLGPLSLSKRQKHYDNCLQPSIDVIEIEDEPTPSSSKPLINGKDSKHRWKPKKPAILGGDTKKDVFWYPSLRSSDPIPDNYTPGLIPLLRNCLLKSHAKGTTIRAVLCCSNAVHVGRQVWDSGWGCGYRNFEMACIALMEQKRQPLYGSLLLDGLPPGVRNLQLWLESAWASGYDPEGANDLGSHLVGTNKWIGTSDLYTAFSSRGIPCELVDFKKSVQRQGIKPLLDWIKNYFKTPSTNNPMNLNASPVLCTEKMPVVLQRKGHSCTIVGYEVAKDQSVNLLQFDPARNYHGDLRGAAIESSKHEPASSRLLAPSPSANVILIDEDDDIEIIEEPVRAPEPQLGRKKAKSKYEPKPEDVRLFRMNSQWFEKFDEFQILYFPVFQPLSPAQKESRKIVKASLTI